MRKRNAEANMRNEMFILGIIAASVFERSLSRRITGGRKSCLSFVNYRGPQYLFLPYALRARAERAQLRARSTAQLPGPCRLLAGVRRRAGTLCYWDIAIMSARVAEHKALRLNVSAEMCAEQ